MIPRRSGEGIKKRRHCLQGDLWKILTDSKSIYAEFGYQGCYVGLTSCPKAIPSGTCKEAAVNGFFASSIISGLRNHLVIIVNAPLVVHPNRAGMYQCLLIVNLTFIIFNHASLLLPNSPLSSCLVPRTPYSPFPLAQGMATRKSTTFAVDQADAWSRWLRLWLTMDP